MNIRILVRTSLVVAAAGIGTAVAGQQAPVAYPAGPGLDLINERCAFCHSAAQVLSVRKPSADWAATVQTMIDRGAELSDEERQVMIDYLASNFGEGEAAAPAPAPATAPAQP